MYRRIRDLREDSDLLQREVSAMLASLLFALRNGQARHSNRRFDKAG